MNRLALIALPALVLAACGQSSGPSTVTAADAWCRAAPASAPAAGCYVTLTASAKDRLVSVATPAAAEGQIHTMSVDGGVMRMRQLEDGLALPKDTAVALKPGGLHIMLIGPKAALVEGATLPMTLTFEKAPPVTLEVPIRARVAAPKAGDAKASDAAAHDMGDHH